MGHRCLLSTWKRSIDWTIQQIMAIKIADRIVKHAPQKKTDPILTLSTRANPDINQSRNRNKQQTMKVFIQNHNKKRVSHGFFLIQIHPVTTWRSASLPNNLRCDMTFNSWITLMVSLAPGPRQFFKTSSSGLLGSPRLVAIPSNWRLMGNPWLQWFFFSKTHIGFCQAILGSNYRLPTSIFLKY